MEPTSHLRVGSPRWHAHLNPAPLRADRAVAHTASDASGHDAAAHYPRGLTIEAEGQRIFLTASEALELLELLRRNEQTLRRMVEEDIEEILALQHEEARAAMRAELEGSAE